MTRFASAEAAARELARAVEREEFAGWDPYDALSSPLLGRLAGTPSLRQLAIQAVKGLPFNIRPALGIPRREHTKALALFASAYARLASLGDTDAATLARTLAERLEGRAIESNGGLGWAYDFDVQTRWAYYRRDQPNAVITAFAAHALLDVAELGEDRFRETVARTLEYARSLLVERPEGSFFAYFGGSRTPIHNANLLVSSIFARARGHAPDGNSSELDGAKAAVDFSLERQRPNGSWPYGDGRRMSWTDGYHTAYILRSLAWWNGVAGAPPVHAALSSGLDLYLTHLIDPDGAPRANLRVRYPIDIHAAGSAIWALSELRDYDERALPTAERVIRWTLANMRRPDGRFAFQRRRLLRNSVPYMRWSDGHMLLGLTSYLVASRPTPSPQPES